ncbi:MAG: amidohydrolase family protein [Anaerovoracaceae bacterium]
MGLQDQNIIADILYFDGKICTLEDSQPWAEAIACKDGKILAFGSVESLNCHIGDHTEKISLSENYLLPGFIEALHSPIYGFFEEYIQLRLYSDWTISRVLKEVDAYVFENPFTDLYFFYGYDPHLHEEISDEEMTLSLDTYATDRPIILLSEDGLSAWMNTCAKDQVELAEKQSGNSPLTFDEVLSIFSPFDKESAKETILEITDDLCRQGYTSVFEGKQPAYFTKTYRQISAEAFGAEEAKQRLCSLSATEALTESIVGDEETEASVGLTPKKVILQRTKEAAQKLNLEKDLGTIAPGKFADFAVFEENPFTFVPKKKNILPDAIITILNGHVVYDSEQEQMEELFSLMSAQQF